VSKIQPSRLFIPKDTNRIFSNFRNIFSAYVFRSIFGVSMAYIKKIHNSQYHDVLPHFIIVTPRFSPHSPPLFLKFCLHFLPQIVMYNVRLILFWLSSGKKPTHACIPAIYVRRADFEISLMFWVRRGVRPIWSLASPSCNYAE